MTRCPCPARAWPRPRDSVPRSILLAVMGAVADWEPFREGCPRSVPYSVPPPSNRSRRGRSARRSRPSSPPVLIPRRRCAQPRSRCCRSRQSIARPISSVAPWPIAAPGCAPRPLVVSPPSRWTGVATDSCGRRATARPRSGLPLPRRWSRSMRTATPMPCCGSSETGPPRTGRHPPSAAPGPTPGCVASVRWWKVLPAPPRPAPSWRCAKCVRRMRSHPFSGCWSG
jgi:hypothetical protein